MSSCLRKLVTLPFAVSLSHRPAPVAWAAASLILVGACAHAPPPPDALLTLQVRPAAAQVYVDEQPVGREAGGVRVPVRGGALYRVEVRAAGHFPAYREVVVPPRGHRDLQIALRPDPDGPVEGREGRSGSAVEGRLPTELRGGP